MGSRGFLNSSETKIIMKRYLRTFSALAIIGGVFARVPGEVFNGQTQKLYRGMAELDRNMQTWWNQFTESWASYSSKTVENPALYCSAPESLLEELGTLLKIDLVKFGLDAKKEQLAQIREILENAEFGGKSGLHCSETPDEPICKALDQLEKQAAQEELKLAAEKQEVMDEIEKVKNYDCACEYEDWKEAWGPCSVTCEEGTKRDQSDQMAKEEQWI